MASDPKNTQGLFDPENQENSESYRVWYHFYVQGFQPGEQVEFVLKNLSNQQKLYSFGMKPHYKVVYED